MTLRNGREFLAIPGPTNVPDAVLNAMHRPAVEIYTGPLLEVTRSLLEDLKRLFGTRSGRTYIYAANGHGAWEAALTNVLSRGDKVLVLGSGRFPTLWGEMGAFIGVEVEELTFGFRHPVDPAAVEARLKADRAGEIKAVLMVQVDTASSVANDVAAVGRAIAAAGHPALLMVDAIASLATMPFEMEAWGVDVAITGSQKGLMTPPGLGLVAAGPRAAAAHQSAGLRTAYWDWTKRDGTVHYQKYCGTPPEHLLFGLRQAIDMLFEEGLEAVFERHRLLAEATRRAVAVWAEGGALDFNVAEPSARSNSVTTVRVEGTDPQRLRDYCSEVCGVMLGDGIGELQGKGIRIAHMGHVNAAMMLGTLGVVETGLAALGIAHGKGGVQAAVDFLAEAVPAKAQPAEAATALRSAAGT
ncbi:MAG: pyridoxal-phosphate-dependent aminotransferase family protein [Bacteroidota bacterium]|nr:aminotransferase class V-fold PLP-dependent enzyme [Kiloniellaceae bacterium]